VKKFAFVVSKLWKRAKKYSAEFVRRVSACLVTRSGITDVYFAGLQRSTYACATCHTYSGARIESASARHLGQTKLFHIGKCTSENVISVDVTFAPVILLFAYHLACDFKETIQHGFQKTDMFYVFCQ
jgi:hypothetical protein